VRIDFQREGGIAAFPGLSRPISIDTDRLSRDQQAMLDRRLRDADFFSRPASIPPPAGAADYRTYTITVADGGREHTIRFTDPVTDPAIEALVAAIEEAARA
jgi:hypothetical protein